MSRGVRSFKIKMSLAKEWGKGIDIVIYWKNEKAHDPSSSHRRK